MKLSVDLIPQFTHKPPKDYSYEVEEFKRSVFAIWILCNRQFDYNLGKPTKSIWGFYNHKECKFYSPVNSKTIGKVVNFKNTTKYTAMPMKSSPLDAFFV